MSIGSFLTASQVLNSFLIDMGMVRKGFGECTSQGCINGEGESRGIWRIKGWRLWMSQSCFSLGFLSQNSLQKLSIIRGYNGYLYWCVFVIRKVSFSQIEWSGNLASRLDWIASLSHELTTWDFCPAVQQLVWLFISPTCFTCVPSFATCQPRDPVTRPYLSAHSWAFLHTLSHTTLTWFSPKYRVSKC